MTGVFYNIPGHGHVNPTLAVVAELTRLGHRIVYYCTEPFRASVESAGAEFRRCDPDLEYDRSRPDPNLVRLSRAFLRGCNRLLPGLLEEASRLAPTFVVHDCMCPWGRMVGHVLQVPTICSTITFAFNRTVLRQEFGRDGCAREPRGSEARTLRQRYGVANLDVLSLLSNPQPVTIVYTIRDLQPCQASFDRRYHFVGPSLRPFSPADADPILSRLRGRPLVYIALGTVEYDAAEFYRTCIEALRDGPWDVVMAVGQRALPALLPAPPGFAIVDFAPQLALLKQASAFITHGGMGSVHEALTYGVPLIVVPQSSEQALVGRQLAKAGAGVVLSRLTARSIRQAVVCSASYAGRAAELAEALRSAGGGAAAAAAINSV